MGEDRVTIAAQFPVPWWQQVGMKSFKRLVAAPAVAVQSSANVWSVRSVPPWIEPLIGRLESVMALESGWDGANGSIITNDALAAALEVLEETMAWDTVAPAVVPVTDGGVQLEWHCAGVDLEVYVDAEGRVSAWCREGSREWEEDFYPRARLRKELSLLTDAFCR
jgi:hypothetical protein